MVIGKREERKCMRQTLKRRLQVTHVAMRKWRDRKIGERTKGKEKTI